jgi:hypothetical protein
MTRRYDREYMSEVKDIMASLMTNLDGGTEEQLSQNRKAINNLQPADEQLHTLPPYGFELYSWKYCIRFGTKQGPSRLVLWTDMSYGKNKQLGDLVTKKEVVTHNLNRIKFHCNSICEAHEKAGLPRPVLWVIGVDRMCDIMGYKLYDELV